MIAVAAVSACTERAIPTSPATLSAPDAIGATSSPAERSKAPATLAWQKTAREQVTAHSTVSPIAAARIYALLGVAQYGAVVAADQARGLRGSDAESDAFDEEDEGGRAQHETRRGAIDAASLAVLSRIFPDAVGVLHDQFDAELRDAKGRTSQFLAGKAIGESMGGVMNAWGANDGFSAKWLPPKYLPWLQDPARPERWYQLLPPVTIPPTPMSPPAGFQFPDMRPYFLTSAAQFHPLPPPAFGSGPFLTALGVVRAFAALPSDDPTRIEQVRIANFWNLPAGSPTALGYWDEQAAKYINERKLGERSAAHILALANAAALDATIGCWEAKYSYGLLRPFQNDPTNTTVFPTPNHPSYPSGHSCVSAAAATVLATYFPEKADELNAGVTEAGLSRIYAGIHYQFDIDAGQLLGRSVAEWALNYDRTRGLLTAVGR